MNQRRSFIFWVLFMTGGLGLLVTPASAQNVSESMKPFVSAADLRAVERDARGNLWFASGGGAVRFGLANHDWEIFPRLLGTGPRGNDLVTLCVDNQERICSEALRTGSRFTIRIRGCGIANRKSGRIHAFA